MSDRTQAPASSQPTVTRKRQKTTIEWVAGKNGKFPWRTGAVLLGGGLLAALLVLASTMWAVPHIEDRLTAETRTDLETAGIDPDGLTIDYDYRDGTISGELAAGLSAAGAEAAVDFEGIRTLGVNLTSAPAPEPAPDPEPAATPAADAEPEADAGSEPDPEPAVDLGPTEVMAEIVDGQIVLTGEVLTEAQRNELVAAAEAALGAGTVVDQLTVTGFDAATPGADDRVRGLALLLGSLGPDVTGTATLTDTTLTFSGSAPDADAAAAIEGAAEGAVGVDATTEVTVTGSDDDGATNDTTTDEGATLDDEVTAMNSELETLRQEILDNVNFEFDSAVLTADAEATLDKVIAVLGTYQLPSLMIEGHTDSAGAADYNLELSQARADAVRDYLIAGGVDGTRLAATGFGESQPISDEVDGRSLANRRVELTAVGELS